MTTFVLLLTTTYTSKQGDAYLSLALLAGLYTPEMIEGSENKLKELIIRGLNTESLDFINSAYYKFKDGHTDHFLNTRYLNYREEYIPSGISARSRDEFVLPGALVFWQKEILVNRNDARIFDVFKNEEISGSTLYLRNIGCMFINLFKPGDTDMMLKSAKLIIED